VILSLLVIVIMTIIVGCSFCIVYQNSYGQFEIPRIYVNNSQLQGIDQSLASYAVIITPGASSQNNPLHYYPKFSAIPVNTTILWYNNNTDQVHTVVSGLPADLTSGQLFTSGLIPYDSYFKYTFDKAGNYSYHCEIHPWKVGFVRVNDKVVRNHDFEISSGTGSILNLTDQERSLLKFKPITFIHDPTKPAPYSVTIWRDKTEEVFSDVFHVKGNDLQLDLVPLDIPTRLVGPDFIKPMTGAYHIEGRFLTQSGNYTVKVQIIPIDNTEQRALQGEYTLRIEAKQ
jgi:plastocyanin